MMPFVVSCELVEQSNHIYIIITLLPLEIRELADKNLQLLKANHAHPSLQLKKVGKI